MVSSVCRTWPEGGLRASDVLNVDSGLVSVPVIGKACRDAQECARWLRIIMAIMVHIVQRG